LNENEMMSLGLSLVGFDDDRQQVTDDLNMERFRALLLCYIADAAEELLETELHEDVALSLFLFRMEHQPTPVPRA
jgi:hypothetical protein